MKTLISLISLVTLSNSTLAFASVDEDAKSKNQYLISAKILRDGTLLSSPKIMSLDGEEAAIEVGDDKGARIMKLTVEAKSLARNPDQVRLKLAFFHSRDGEDVKYKSRMVVKDDGTEVIIPVENSAGHLYMIHISAEQQ